MKGETVGYKMQFEYYLRTHPNSKFVLYTNSNKCNQKCCSIYLILLNKNVLHLILISKNNNSDHIINYMYLLIVIIVIFVIY
jgi:hypothetical protein